MTVSARMLLALLALGQGACIKAILLNGQIQGTREASSAFDLVDDFELAEKAASSGLVQFEGMHQLAPDNTDGLFLLTKGYTGYAYGFIEDALERAEDEGDGDLAQYHRQRGINAYGRAVAYGLELLAHRAPGFDTVKGDDAALRGWLEASFQDPAYAGDLFWTGYAWVARTNLMKDDAEAVANLYIGVAMLERSVALDPNYNNCSGHVVLGAYHARAATAELDESKALLESVMQRTSSNYLLAQFNYASKYACARADYELYNKLLREVVDSRPDAPTMSLSNTIAKRRAARWLGEKRMFDNCSLEPPVAQSEEAPAEPAADPTQSETPQG